jgi:futalosine hydrolase
LRILVVAATAAEVAPFAARLRHTSNRTSRIARYNGIGHELDILVSGVGMIATAAWTSRELARERYDLALNVGVCGSFSPRLPLGAVVHVATDRIAELGAEDGDDFLTVQQLRLLDDNEFPFERGKLVNTSPPSIHALASLRTVDGITVNTAHGSEPSIRRVVDRFNPDVESMEGAGFMYAALIHGVPFAQVRAVSNVVERRNRSAWKLDLAVAELGDAAWRLLQP